MLGEDDWQDYRDVRLAALQESPEAFLATYADEVAQQEQDWRNRVLRADRLLAERDGAALGVASVEVSPGTAQAADLCDLWVIPEARKTGVASHLVQAAADQAVRDGCAQLYYWVSTENGRAIAFATNAGFRVTSKRRAARVENQGFGDQEIALVLPLANDPGAVPTSTPSRLTSRTGPR